jgi:DNA-binding PadR family transcriptional regulator
MTGHVYELVVLARLMLGDAHGYLIARVVNDAIGPFARLSHGRLYPVLSRLEEGGLIESVPRAARARGARSYRITDAGRRRFRELMMDTRSNLGDYQRTFLLKALAMGQLSPEDRVELIEHYRDYCRSHVRHLRAETRELEAQTHEADATLEVMRHRLELWKLEAGWARDLLREHDRVRQRR